MWAAKYGHKEVAAVLLEAGAGVDVQSEVRRPLPLPALRCVSRAAAAGPPPMRVAPPSR